MSVHGLVVVVLVSLLFGIPKANLEQALLLYKSGIIIIIKLTEREGCLAFKALYC